MTKMKAQVPAGRYFRGFLSSGSLSTPAAIPLFDADGRAITLAANERLVITTVFLCGGATPATYTIFSDNDADGVVDTGEALLTATA
jgi:hypothetical protein